uniref:Uncharacterized protein n=1 Tax=Rhizophora mucronata TaxID=61149 RepID=A0A2P2PIN0_RHIMU
MKSSTVYQFNLMEKENVWKKHEYASAITNAISMMLINAFCIPVHCV